VPFPKPSLVSILTSTLLAGVPNPTPAQQAGAAAQANGFANLYVAALPVIPVDYNGSQPEVVETSADLRRRFVRRNAQVQHAGRSALRPRGEHWQQRADGHLRRDLSRPRPRPGALTRLCDPGEPVRRQHGRPGQLDGAREHPQVQRLPAQGRTASYDWTADVTTSLTAQRGYRSGGATVNIARSQVSPYDQEYTWNYEAALRTAWLDGSLTVNANAFYTDWKDQQVLVNLGLNLYDYQVENAGKSHLYGFEVEVAQRVDAAPQLVRLAGPHPHQVRRLHRPRRHDQHQPVGRGIPLRPALDPGAGADYRWSNGLVAHLDGNYHSKSFSQADIDQSTDSLVKSRVLLNGRFGYEREHWGLYVFGKNLLDQTYSQYVRTDVQVALLGDPRVVGVSLETRW
jgi:iron complex outermembrane receptor protein